MSRPVKTEKLTDPVDGVLEKRSEEAVGEAFSIKNLKPQALKSDVVKITSPFDGYPFKFAGTGKNKVCLTHIVLYNHKAFPVRNDPANRGKIKTFHNRCIRDEVTKENNDIVFDRPYETAEGVVYGAIVPSDNLRAQVCFMYDTKTQRVKEDNRYLLLDPDQGKPLMRMFRMVINPKIKIEQQADFISGYSDKDPGDTEPLSGE